jgi:hypothetical protein
MGDTWPYKAQRKNLGGSEVWTQGLEHARQALYNLSYIFNISIVWIIALGELQNSS